MTAILIFCYADTFCTYMELPFQKKDFTMRSVNIDISDSGMHIILSMCI